MDVWEEKEGKFNMSAKISYQVDLSRINQEGMFWFVSVVQSVQK